MDNQYKRMTVNERLYVSGLIDDFDKAIVKKDIEKIVEILNRVGIIDEFSIRSILQSFNLVE